MNEKTKILIRRCQKEKRKAQAELYKIYSPVLFSICLRYSDNYEDAQDAFQDGFILIFKKIKQFRFEGSFEGWIKRVMVNVCIEKHRKKNYLYVVREEITEDKYSEDFEIEVEENEHSYKDLLGFIQNLPPRYRQVFNLYVLEGYSHKQIAKKLGISEGTSKSNLSRAREKLMDEINKKKSTKVIFK